MKLGMVNHGGRAGICIDGRVYDLERDSGGTLSADPMRALAEWEAVLCWAEDLGPDVESQPLDRASLLAPVPAPEKIFGVGLNYHDHASEAGLDVPKSPLIFTKFPNCLQRPDGEVELSSDRVDWEAELVVVVGRGGRGIAEAQALSHVAGFMVGQDISDRRLQFSGKPPQFSIGKSIDTFGPIGPAVVPLSALEDPADLAITCDVAGERMQESRTSEMIFSVPELISWLSRYCTLKPGDLIFTGTPAGVGSVRDPRRYLAQGDRIVTTIEGLGSLENPCVLPRG